MILSAQSIRNCQKLVTPFNERSVFQGMSYGLSSAGYDIRVAQDLVLPQWGFVLGSSLELFDMPTDAIGIVHSKSTWARKGVSVDNTVIEPGWKGYLTLELSNHSGFEVRIQAGSPIAQIIFHELDEPTEQPYKGKYQNQENRPVGAREE